MFMINSCTKGAGELRKDSEVHHHCIWSDMKESTLFIGGWLNCEDTKFG